MDSSPAFKGMNPKDRAAYLDDIEKQTPEPTRYLPESVEKASPRLAAAVELPLRALSGAGGELLSQAGRVAQYTPGLQRLAPTLSRLGTPREGIGEGIGRYGAQGLEFMAPGGAEERAAGMIGGALRSAPGLVRGTAELLPAAVSSGAVSALQGTGFAPGAALGAVGGMAGKALEAGGAGMATRAAGVTEKQLKYGAKPAEEILGLRGIRPGTIRQSAQTEAGNLTRELESKIDASGATVDFTPAKQALDKAINKAADQRDLATFSHLQPLADQLAGIPDKLPAREALDAKRGLGSLADFQSGSAVTKPAKAAARQVYHAADESIDRAVPEANALDDRIHSLVTIAQPKGSGRAGMGGILIPWLAERATESLGGGPVAGLAGSLAALAGMSPASRIAIGKGMAALPRFGRMLRAPILQAAQGGEQP